MQTLVKSKPKSKAAELREKYSEGSSCNVLRCFENGKLSRIEITFRGPISRIPALKNSKIPGTNFMAADVKQRLLIMDRLFNEEIRNSNDYFNRSAFYGWPCETSFGDDSVFMLVICGKRSGRFDKDNVASTVQDWLEPRTKQIGKRKKRDRGWGVGVVNNDRQITCLTFNEHQTNIYLPEHSTKVVLTRFDSVALSFKPLFQALDLI